MKMLITLALLIPLLSFAQTSKVKKSNKTLDEAIDEIEETKAYQSKNEYYHIKYDVNFKPYYELTFLNKSPKTITSLSVTYSYYIGKAGFISSQNLNKIIKSNGRGRIILMLDDEKLKGYRKPEDFRQENLAITNMRFTDGTIKGSYISLAYK